MTRRFVPLVLAAAVAAVLLPATASHARCAGDVWEPDTALCIANCVLHWEQVYC